MNNREIKIGAILNYTRLFLSLGIGFFLSPFVLKCLGQSEFGVYTIAGTIISWLALCDFGLTASATKFISEYHAKGDLQGEAHYIGTAGALFSIIGIVVLVLGLCIYPFLGNIFEKFSPDELKLYKILYLLALFNTVVMFPLRSLAGISAARQKYTIPGVVSTITSIAGAVGTVVLLASGYKSIALTILSISVGILTMAWNVFYSFYILKAKMSWNGWDFPLIKTMYSFSFWLFLDQCISVIHWGSGGVIIGITRGANEIAPYAYGLSLMQYYFMCSNCIASLFLPRVVSIVQSSNDNHILTKLWSKIGRVHVLILGLPLTGVVIFGKEFLSLWVGNVIGEETLTSWYVAIILMISVSVNLVQCLGWQILQAKNAIKYRVKVLLLISLFNLILAFIFSKWYGAIGLAVGTALSLVCGEWLYMNALYKYKIGLNVKLFARDVFPKFETSSFHDIVNGYFYHERFVYNT